jgi:hypothetical protein
MSTLQVSGVEDTRASVLRECVAALRRMSTYHLPAALDQRLLWLSENKEALTEPERQELLALVDFAQDRTVDKLQARALLRKFEAVWPEVATATP